MLRTDRILLVLIVLIVVLIGLGVLLPGAEDERGLDRRRAAPAAGSAPPLSPRREPESSAGPAADSDAAEPRAVGSPPATAALELRFEAADPRLVAGIEVRLEGRGAGGEGLEERLGASDEEGRLLFAGLRPGDYRWTHDGRRSVAPVPPHEEAAVAAEGGRILVRPGRDRTSGRIRLEPGDERSILVPVSAGCVVTGRVVDGGGTLTMPVALKLVSRERFVHPAGTVVERILDRQARCFATGEFRFEEVHAGVVELLGYWRDEEGLAQVQTVFELQPGEFRHLDAVAARAGRDVAIRLDARERDGRALAPEELFGAGEILRVVEIRPQEPTTDWPYQKVELPMGRDFLLRGLPEGSCRLLLAREDAMRNRPRAGFLRVGPAEIALPEGAARVAAVEDWSRRARLTLRLDGETDPVAADLLVIDRDGGEVRRIRSPLGPEPLELELPAGRYRILAGLHEGGARAAASGDFRLGVEGRELVLAPERAGRVVARARDPERAAAIELGGEDWRLRLEPDHDGRFDLVLPPGRYRRYDREAWFRLEAGEVLDLGVIEP